MARASESQVVFLLVLVGYAVLRTLQYILSDGRFALGDAVLNLVFEEIVLGAVVFVGISVLQCLYNGLQ